MLFYQLFFCVLAYFVIDALRFRNTATFFTHSVQLDPRDVKFLLVQLRQGDITFASQF